MDRTPRPTEQANNTLRSENLTLRAQVGKLNELLTYSNELSSRLRAQNDKIIVKKKSSLSPSCVRQKIDFSETCSQLRGITEDVTNAGATTGPCRPYLAAIETLHTTLCEHSNHPGEWGWWERSVKDVSTRLVELGRDLLGPRGPFTPLRVDTAQLDGLRKENAFLMNQIPEAKKEASFLANVVADLSSQIVDAGVREQGLARERDTLLALISSGTRSQESVEERNVQMQIETEAASVIEALRHHVGALASELSEERRKHDAMRGEAEKVKTKLKEIMHGLQTNKVVLEQQDSEIQCLQDAAVHSDERLRGARAQLEGIRRMAEVVAGHDVDPAQTIDVLSL